MTPMLRPPLQPDVASPTCGPTSPRAHLRHDSHVAPHRRWVRQGRAAVSWQAIVKATINIYNTRAAEMLPTPAKSHYTFNLRDLSKVFQGLLRADPRVVAEDKNELLRLWMHESLRVFADRLVNLVDKGVVRRLIDAPRRRGLGRGRWTSSGEKDWTGGRDDEVEERRRARLIYGDLHDPGADAPRVRAGDDTSPSCRDHGRRVRSTSTTLSRPTPMNLVFFPDAIEHVSASRASCASRAATRCSSASAARAASRSRASRRRMWEYEVLLDRDRAYDGKNEWRDDLKVILHGGRGGPPLADVVFLFTDTQIVKEIFLEDINNILNSGEVPNLMDPEDMKSDPRGAPPTGPRRRASRDARRDLRPLRAARAREPAHRAVHVAHRRRLPRALPHVPVADQLLHDRLVRRVAQGRAALRGAALLRAASPPDAELKKADLRDVRRDALLGRHDRRRLLSPSCKRRNYTTPTSYLELLNLYLGCSASSARFDRRRIALPRRPQEARRHGGPSSTRCSSSSSWQPVLAKAREGGGGSCSRRSRSTRTQADEDKGASLAQGGGGGGEIAKEAQAIERRRAARPRRGAARAGQAVKALKRSRRTSPRSRRRATPSGRPAGRWRSCA